MSLVRIVAQGTTNTFNQSLFFSPHTKTQQTKKIPVYRMRGQIYSQSGSRVIRLDAFLEWSFLFLLLSFFEVSPRLPPLPQHSSLLFILYKYNQTGQQPTLVYILSFCWFVLHTYTCTKTHTHKAHTYTDVQWELLTKRGGLVKRPSSCHHSNIDTQFDILFTPAPSVV